MTGGRSVRLTAAGHPAVTGRHGKTLELTAAPGITARATCVLGVTAGPLPGDLPGLRGRVRLDLAAGDATATVQGEVNPYYASTGRLVVRRSDLLDPDTFLVNASAAAADLDPALLARLRDPAIRLDVTATELGDPDPVLLVLRADPGPPPPVVTLAAQTDTVVDLTGPGSPAPPVDLPGRRQHRVPAGLAGIRTVAVLVRDLAEPALRAVLPGARVVVWPPAPGADLLLAAGVPAHPALHAGRLPTTAADRRDLATLVAATPAPVVLTIDPVTVPAAPRNSPAAAAADPAAAGGVPRAGSRRERDPVGAIAELRERLPAHTLLLPDPVVGWGVGAVRVAPGEPLDPALLRGLRHAPALALVPAPDREPPLSVDPAELAARLRAAGLSGRDAAATLTALGMPRRAAYRLATEDR